MQRPATPAAIANKSTASEQSGASKNDQDNQDGKWSMKEWYRQSHTNPKTQTFSAADKQSVDAYPKLIRKGLTDTMLKEN